MILSSVILASHRSPNRKPIENLEWPYTRASVDGGPWIVSIAGANIYGIRSFGLRMCPNSSYCGSRCAV